MSTRPPCVGRYDRLPMSHDPFVQLVHVGSGGADVSAFGRPRGSSRITGEANDGLKAADLCRARPAQLPAGLERAVVDVTSRAARAVHSAG
jgi:hypothetical protein